MTNDVVDNFGTVITPDDKWGLVVVIGAFCAHVIVHGIVYSFGILFIAIHDVYEGGKTEVSWIPSITTGALYLIGPVASIVIHHYGNRVTVIAGGVLGSLGYILSIFVPQLYYLYFTMGVITGCGFGMIFLPSILIVTKYFDKYRALACGMALSGAGGGAFIFSPLIEHLLQRYAWRGTLLILSGIILNCIPCGLVFLSPTKKVVYEINDNKHKEETVTTHGEPFSLEQDIEYGQTTKHYRKLGVAIEEEQSRLLEEPSKDVVEKAVRFDTPDVLTAGEQHRLLRETTKDAAEEERSKQDKTTAFQKMDITLHNLKSSEKKDNVSCTCEHKNSTSYDKCSAETCIEADPICIEIIPNQHLQNKTVCVINHDNKIESAHRISDDINLSSIKSRYLVLFKTIDVLVFFISQFLFFSGFYLPFIYIPDKARSHGIEESHAAWIASTMGMSSIVGRIALGYIADRPSVNRFTMFKIAVLMAGVSTAIVPLQRALWHLLVFAVVYGISTGITLSLTSVVLVDLSSIDLLPDAMGINNVFSAIGSFVGPPVAGLLYDNTGDYTASFLMTVISMTLASVLVAMAPFCHKVQKRLQTTKK